MMELVKSVNGFYVLGDGTNLVVCKDLPELFKELEFAFDVPLPEFKEEANKKEKKKVEPDDTEPEEEGHWDGEGLDL